jgi:polar amino acid transport system permease protein
MEFDLTYLAQQLPALGRGLLLTLAVSGAALVVSLLIGLAGAAARDLRVPVLSWLAAIYVELIRNTPLLVQIFFIVYGLPAVGLRLSLFWSGVVALGLWAGAYQIENIRGGLSTVGKGVREAGLALGLRSGHVLVLVALPSALRGSLPAMLNTAISMLKNSAYLQAIGLADLTFVAMDRISMDFRTLEMLAVMLGAYVSLVWLLAFGAGLLERRLNRAYAR